MYSAQVLDHFQNPRNAGEIENPDAAIQVENPACGDILRLSAKMLDGHLAEVCFRAKGCVPTMACASALTELIKGKTPDDAQRVRQEEVIREVGGVPEASGHAAQLAIDALDALLKAL